MARDADNLFFVSFFLSNPGMSESLSSSSAVSEESQSRWVEVAVKNRGSAKTTYSIPCLCCLFLLELSCSIQLSQGVLQLYRMWVPKPTNLASSLCSVPKTGFGAAGKSGSLNKASHGFCLFVFTWFPRGCVLPWAVQGLTWEQCKAPF